MIRAPPVSPPTHSSDNSSGGAAAPDNAEAHRDADEVVDYDVAMMDQPLVGVEQAQPDGPEARPIRSPKPMTPAEKAVHDLTHQPPDPSCPICASSRTPNLQHASSHEHLRTIPLLVGDYCFLRRRDESYLATCLVLRLYPYKIFMACIAPHKGVDPLVIRMVTKFVRDMGLVHFAYRCDREAALNAMIEDAINKAGRTAQRVHSDDPAEDSEAPSAVAEEEEPDAPTHVPQTPQAPFVTIAVPELTHPGESATNGLAERSVRTLQEQIRTLLTALEAHIHLTIPSSHPILSWIVHHSAYILNKYQTGLDKKTPFARLHGKETNEKMVEFGEKIL